MTGRIGRGYLLGCFCGHIVRTVDGGFVARGNIKAVGVGRIAGGVVGVGDGFTSSVIASRRRKIVGDSLEWCYMIFTVQKSCNLVRRRVCGGVGCSGSGALDHGG